MDFPIQLATDRQITGSETPDSFDMREHLNPRRLTLAMWDQAFALRHGPGGSFEDYDRVLDEAIERGYNTLRSESWSSWFHLDTPGLDWGWLLEWSAWSVEDAIDHGMWGWTPHNYVQPQFKNWQNVKWRQAQASRFLNS